MFLTHCYNEFPHCFEAIEIFVDVVYSISVYHNWTNYYVFIFKNMDVAANGPHPLSDIARRAPLLKFLEITPARQ